MSKVKIEVKVSYWVGMEIEEKDINTLDSMKSLDDGIIYCNGNQTDEQQNVIDWIDSNINQSDAYEFEYEIEQLEIDNEEII